MHKPFKEPSTALTSLIPSPQFDNPPPAFSTARANKAPTGAASGLPVSF